MFYIRELNKIKIDTKMNKSYFFKTMIAFLAFTVIISCGSDSAGSVGGDDDPSAGPTSLTITSNIQSAVIEQGVAFQFTVTGDDNVAYTSTSTLFVNDAQISATNYTASTIGSYEVYATRGDLTSNKITLQADTGVTGIVVTTPSVSASGSNAIFSATNNLEIGISSDVVFFVNGTEITGNAYNTATVGTYEVYGTYENPLNGENHQSVTISYDVVDVPVFSQKVLVEDYTGTWCGYCPRLAYNLEQAEMQDSRVVGVGVHSGDVMETAATSPMESAYGVNSWPDGRINRNINWNESVSQVISYIGDESDLGLAINSTLNGSTITVDVKVGYATSVSGSKLVVYLLEDGLLYDQRNYMNDDANSPWYQAGDPIANFEHNNVLRLVFSDVFGDTIADGQLGSESATSFTASVPSAVQDNSKLEIVAFVIGDDGRVVNVQHAALGENKDFD